MLEAVSRPLEVANNVTLTDEQIERLCAIEEYDLWFVIERVEKKGAIAPHLIGEAVKEFKKYMALIALGYTEIGMSSQEIDEVWHNFILFTREYAEFCDKVCGKIIHHRPNTSRRPQLPAASITDFASAYAKFFGDLPPVWQAQGMMPGNAVTARALLNVDCDAGPSCSSAIGDCDVGGPACNSAVGDCDVVRGPTCRSST
jgi:hypothetical protein